MSTNSHKLEIESAGFELKAANFTLPVVRLFDTNLELVAQRLSAKVAKAPDFFHHMPVVLDLSALPLDTEINKLSGVVSLLRRYGMIPFGVRGGSKLQNNIAEELELAILSEAYERRKSIEYQNENHQNNVTTPPVPIHPSALTTELNHHALTLGSMLVTRPVRSGQRVYAAGGDLSIIAAVSSGAELMADGHIHVYGAMRGRALAGMSGNVEARIFCQDLQAELVSIAGHYRVSENIPMELRGCPVQVFLDQKILRIEKL